MCFGNVFFFAFSNGKLTLQFFINNLLIRNTSHRARWIQNIHLDKDYCAAFNFFNSCTRKCTFSAPELVQVQVLNMYIFLYKFLHRIFQLSIVHSEAPGSMNASLKIHPTKTLLFLYFSIWLDNVFQCDLYRSTSNRSNLLQNGVSNAKDFGQLCKIFILRIQLNQLLACDVGSSSLKSPMSLFRSGIIL